MANSRPACHIEWCDILDSDFPVVYWTSEMSYKKHENQKSITERIKKIYYVIIITYLLLTAYLKSVKLGFVELLFTC